MKRISILLVVLVLLQSCQYFKAVQFPREKSRDGFFAHIHTPGNIAHRGASGRYPENTIPAFSEALRKGAVAIELDVWITKDDEVVVIHDKTVDRTTNAEGNVGDFTLEEIQKLDAAYHFLPERNYPFRGKGIYIPTLDEVLERFSDTPVLVEIKEGGKQAALLVAEVIKKKAAQDRVLLASFNDRTLRIVGNSLPGVPRTAGSFEVFGFYVLAHLGVAGLMPWSFEGLFIPPKMGVFPILTFPMRNASIAAGMHTYVWTINDEQQMKRLLMLRGVDGILTDYPAELEDAIEKLRNPSE